jgi:glycosyltransferase EpsF
MILEQATKPTVVIATGTMNTGGTESLIMEILRQSTGRVRYVLLIHQNGPIVHGVYDSEIRQLGVDMRNIGSIGSLGVSGYIKAFTKAMAEIGHVDIVHSHLNASGGIIALAAKKCGIKYRICHCHADIRYPGGIIQRLKSEISLIVMKAFIEMFATERWACSQAAWNRLFMPWRRRMVVNNMIDTCKYLTTSGKRCDAKERYGLKDKFIVGAVGRVAPIKNYECVLKALVGTDAHFVCFGRFDANNSYCKSLIDLSDNLGIRNQVHWLGNSNDISIDIHCIDLFVMPSLTEGFGMAAIEAQAASIPSILSTGVPHGVDVGLELVKFANPENSDEWHKAIINFTPSPILPDNEIFLAFRNKGFDSVLAVEHIENQYISLTKDK